MKSLSRPPIKVETFKRNLRHELLKEARAEALRQNSEPRGAALYWGFLVSSLSAATFAATAILFIAIPSLPAKLHQALGGTVAQQHPIQTSSAYTQDNAFQTQRPQYETVNLKQSDIQFLENMVQHELPDAGFDPAMLQDDGEVVLRRYRDASGRVILVVTETEEAPMQPQEDDRVY